MATTSVKPSGASASKPQKASDTARERPAVRRRPRRPQDEPVPVVSGRYLIAAGFIGAMILIPFSPLGRWLENKGPEPHDMTKWTAGTVTRVRLTVVTADYNLLSCASDKALAGTHCAYKTENEGWPRDPSAPLDDNKANVIQPYRTWPDNKLVLVAGLWADPLVAMRLHREPYQGVATKKLVRFVADCEMKFLGKLETPKLRWTTSGPWQDEGPGMVAKPISCSINE